MRIAGVDILDNKRGEIALLVLVKVQLKKYYLMQVLI